MKKLITILGMLCLAPLGLANDADAVNVPSLEVKERLQSIEQINVTAENPAQDEAPVSEAVAELLDEARTLDLALDQPAE